MNAENATAGFDTAAVAFLDRHYVLLSAMVGVVLSFVLRHWTRPKTNDDHEESSGSVFDVVDDPDGFGGTTEKYVWTQNENEVEVYVPSPPGLSAKDVECVFKRQWLRVVVLGETIVDAETPKEIDSDECTWQLDRDTPGATTVWLTLRKRQPTQKSRHWPCVVIGDPQIDTTKFGPPIMAVNADDPNSMHDAVSSMNR